MFCNAFRALGSASFAAARSHRSGGGPWPFWQIRFRYGESLGRSGSNQVLKGLVAVVVVVVVLVMTVVVAAAVVPAVVVVVLVAAVVFKLGSSNYGNSGRNSGAIKR